MLTIATILDAFTGPCMQHEGKLLAVGKNDYVKVLENNDIDFLFVESTWGQGIKPWNFAYDKSPKQLLNLLDLCHKRKIPTVFWCQQDPIHFKRFLDKACLFDYVFTTDSNCVQKYKDQIGHNKVFCLPFSIQPNLHNILNVTKRKKLPCFAGSFFRKPRTKAHKKRQEAMNYILFPALKYGLHIYDRSTAGGSGHSFPEKYKKAIRKGLPYQDIVEVYKKYSVFLNLNTVIGSPTMFSRRVVELLACGTPVISMESLGIERNFPEVLITKSSQQTIKQLVKLFNDEDYWLDLSLRGIKSSYSAWTYSHRLKNICNIIGITVPQYIQNRIDLFETVAKCTTHNEIKILLEEGLK